MSFKSPTLPPLTPLRALALMKLQWELRLECGLFNPHQTITLFNHIADHPRYANIPKRFLTHPLCIEVAYLVLNHPLVTLHSYDKISLNHIINEPEDSYLWYYPNLKWRKYCLLFKRWDCRANVNKFILSTCNITRSHSILGKIYRAYTVATQEKYAKRLISRLDECIKSKVWEQRITTQP